jgi:hypothetical protein
MDWIFHDCLCNATSNKVQDDHRTYIQRCQAVPAENMLATLAHHLSAAFIFLDRNIAHGTTLDEIGVKRNAWFHEICVSLLGQASCVLLAGNS